MNKKTIIYIVIALLISSTVFFIDKSQDKGPRELYRVYLDGATIGYIESEDELNGYIDKQESQLKNTYKVDKVYAPKNLKIVKEISYDKDVKTTSQIYNMIKNKEPFTIEGYTITMGATSDDTDFGEYSTDTTTINVLDKEVFTKALKSTMNVFISEKDYNNYINKTQKEITNTGTIIENVYIENEITIKKNKISTNDKIYTDSDELSKFLLFGTLEAQKTYTVKTGDTIEQVSYDNKLSVEEFLIANTEFNSVDNLLYPGEVVTLGVLKPGFKLVEEDHVVELETSKYKTEVEYDNSMFVGTEKVKQEGENGVNKVTKKIKKANGATVSAIVISSEVIQPTKNKIIVRGKAQRTTSDTYNTGDLGTWAWPTKTPYVITSPFGYRWGKLHEAVDISVTGHGSPIYAANDGVVEESRYDSYNGNFIIINHNNGYYTIYAHLSALLVKKGQDVTIGQQIGRMGSTGHAYGTHLHFGLYKGYPYRGGTPLNPMRLYK